LISVTGWNWLAYLSREEPPPAFFFDLDTGLPARTVTCLNAPGATPAEHFLFYVSD
jgi:hypothetical protein